MKFIHILYLLSLSLLLTTRTFAQDVKELNISGKVIDKDNEPLLGVSIYIKNQPSIGTATNIDGKFSIKVNYGDKVVFTYLGYDPTEYIAVESKKDLIITLDENSQSLDELVVVGLGNVQRKISSVGAISTVSTKDIQTPAPSIGNLLGGRVAGVISLQSSSLP